MTAKVFENPHVRISPTLFFEVKIFLRPFSYDGEVQRSTLRLDFIEFGVSDWRELPSRQFNFPKNPAKGCIDGSLYLADVHNPADVTRIRFGALERNALPVELDLELDFTYEGPAELGRVSVTWQVDLAIDSSLLGRVIEEARRVVKRRKG